VSRTPRHDGARRIFIHLDRVSSPDVFDEYGPRVCPFYNYFQPALVLLEQGALDPLGALRVAAELVIHHGFTPDALVASYVDVAQRRHVGRRAAALLVEAIESLEEAHFAATYPVLKTFGAELEGAMHDRADEVPPPAPLSIDYVDLFSRDKARARRARERVLGR
jgi:hypothetical protein